MESMLKHIFWNLKYLFFWKKKENLKYIKVLAVCNTKKHFYILIKKNIIHHNK